MNRKEIVSTLISKFGSLDTVRYYVKEMHNGITSMKLGIAENNFALASKEIELLSENLSYLEYALGMDITKQSLLHSDAKKELDVD